MTETKRSAASQAPVILSGENRRAIDFSAERIANLVEGAMDMQAAAKTEKDREAAKEGWASAVSEYGQLLKTFDEKKHPFIQIFVHAAVREKVKRKLSSDYWGSFVDTHPEFFEKLGALGKMITTPALQIPDSGPLVNRNDSQKTSAFRG